MEPDLSSRLTSPHPIFRVELEQAAFNHGFRKSNGTADGWFYFKSDEGVPGEVALACGNNLDGSPWYLAIDHPGAAIRLRDEFKGAVTPSSLATFCETFSFETLAEFRSALSRAFHLSRSLPNYPLVQFEETIATLTKTEAQAFVRRRVGQDLFRSALIDFWNGRCVVTGITENALLRASHIIPWAECQSDEERLNVHNGLLLAAHLDALFDKGLISFNDAGKMLLHSKLGEDVVQLIRPNLDIILKLGEPHRDRLAWHRKNFGFE